MTITLRNFAKTFIQTEPGVDKEGYLKQFAAQALSAAPHPPYSRDIEFNSHQTQPAPQDFAGRLLSDSELASDIPLAPASSEPDVNFDDLPPAVKRVYENYPLVDGERISAIRMLCLEGDWEGMTRGTLFFERVTNLSRAYFAVPRFRVAPRTPGLTPALLLGHGSAPVTKRSAAMALSPSATAGADTPDDSGMNALGDSIASLTLDTISTLSWATPAGPFVSAAISIFKALTFDAFGHKEDITVTIKRVADDIVHRIEYFEENRDLQEKIKSLQVFSSWLSKLEGELSTQSREAFANAVLAPAGILFQLNNELGPNVPNNLFALQSTLSDDDDLKSGGAYASPHRWSMANAKLRLLLLATSQYLLALKFKILLIARLYESGYDTMAHHVESTDQDPDTTFNFFISEMKGFKEKLPGLISNVRSRREGMVVLEVTNTSVAYSKAWMSVADREQWKSRMNGHDALYRGNYHDQMVRSLEDGPTVEEFESHDNDSFDSFGRGHRYPPTVNAYWWQRTEIRDMAIFNGKDPQDWILSNSYPGSNNFEHQTDRAKEYRARYLARILESFDKSAKIPGILDASIASLLDKWTPQIPLNMQPPVKLFIDNWGGTAQGNEIWSDKKVSVRYRFTLRSTIGNESEKSNDVTSTGWVDLEGKCRPEIKGLPVQGDYLQYVQSVCVYRQFRKELHDGPPKYGSERKVAVIPLVVNNESKNVFAGSVVDKASTAHDERDLS